ncbi:hypothetical protein, partial [Enterococcus faecium]|uniref:hypothetical protein n=1 Tax=Enterococcus faecium TaxID=1352 RepID=UPI00272E1802
MGMGAERDHAEEASAPEVLGEIKATGPKVSAWTDPETQTQIEMEEGPAPWEVAGGPDSSDARNYLHCPESWVFYW